MHPARTIGRLARILAAAPAAALAGAAAPARAATPRPRPPGWNKLPPLPAGPHPALGFPPGWNKLSPLPAHVHPLAATAIPGWQLTLMAVTVVLLAATLVAIAYPGPGRTAAGERAHRLSDDRIPRHADPQGQPAALARPAPDRRNHQAGCRP